ncbi:MAG: amino acid-binding protein [Coriobacteriia bacterium]|nr:amino acid-binding protein [Coriobacteriia bacterium]
MIDQLTVCLPDGPGKLAQMCHVLGENGVQIHALMVAETVDFGIIRVICDKPRTTAALLREKGYNAMCARVVAAEVENVPGALGRLLDRLASSDLNVEYAYTCSLGERAVDVIKATGEPLEIKLRESGLAFLEAKDLYQVD